MSLEKLLAQHPGRSTMCGIAGFVSDHLPEDNIFTIVHRMIARQRHRGPDGEGYYRGRNVALGHCRLAIIDPTEMGSQPMLDDLGRYSITFNGEIYNYLELRAELLSFGCCFRSRSDTEVLLKAYERWGVGCLKYLRGMFAFAIWDNVDQVLFAARDRLGIKPFHYWMDGGSQFAFASEVKALLEFVPQRRANLDLASDFILWNLLDHDGGRTMINGIDRLKPGNFLKWRIGEPLEISSYWQLNVDNADLLAPCHRRSTLTSEFRSLFDETVSLHLRSDVPVGSCLSGGLDSSSIVCVVNSRLRRRDLGGRDWQQTFSACFDRPDIDERAYIDSVVEWTGCRSNHVFPDGDRLASELDDLLWHQDEPIGGFGVYSQYCVARLARERGIKVLLDGQGADEQLAGYRKFIMVYIRQLFKEGEFQRALVECAAFGLSPDIFKTSFLSEGLRYFVGPPREIACAFRGATATQRPRALAITNDFNTRLAYDMTTVSLPVLLRYEDRNSMAFGVESRVPFVDHVLVEWIASLPADMRLYHGWTKAILRNAMKGCIPEKIRLRKTKLGFATPDSAWLRSSLRNWLCEMLNNARHLDALVDRRWVERLFDQAAKPRSGDWVALPLLFRLAIYENWARLFLEQKLL